MFFGLTFEKILLIGVIAGLLIGPERLPKYAATFSQFVRRAGEYMRGAKDKVREEVGPEINDLDWRKLDPRQYDPRRIIRDALMDDTPPAPAAIAGAGTAAGVGAVAATSTVAATSATPPRVFSASEPPPFDLEAT
ncbi:sec-independent protein translocase protein TatB [Microbacterium resistens]|uniref:Sec-independent protein translocase protein TatB n=1 Tax=Microbacterium resistens TaxID=156977 RepID=A0ABU1S7G7_9MICO|nr:Sec-independent protein translocase TatB [Microbacterium resistens]MDR6865540.1 sec-independent protein translocase protein TatB [Microbacterium resistens]